MAALGLGLGLGLSSAIKKWFLSDTYKADGGSPSLIADFANNRYAANSGAKSFSDVFSFTRASTATYFDSAGVMRTAAIDTRRLYHDPATGAALGLLVEGQRTNLCLQSNNIKSVWITSKSGTGASPFLDVIDSNELVNLPDSSFGSAAGKGFTPTGLCYDSRDNCFWVGNFGKATPASSPAEPAIVQLSLDGTTIISEFVVSGGPQGVTYDILRDKLYYAYGGNSIRSVNKDGTDESVILSGFSNANGVAYDSMRDNLWLTDGADFVRIDLSGVEQQRFTYSLSAVDQLFYDAEHDWLWVSNGGSGSAGFVAVLKCSDGSVIKNWYRFADAYAIEGIVIKDGCMYVTNDGYYHQADIADSSRHLNQIQKYPIDFGIISGALPCYLKLDIGAGNTSADNSWIQQNIVSAGNRTFSAYIKAAHGDDPLLTLRVDDSSGAWYENVITKDSWARYSLNKSSGTTTQAVKVLLRGDRIHTPTARIWIQAMQLEDGDIPSSYIPTTSAAVTRSADIITNTAANTVKFADWYNQTEGTVLAKFSRRYQGTTGYPPIFNINDTTSNEFIETYINEGASNAVAGKVVDGGVTQMDLAGGQTYTLGTDGRVAMSYKLNDCAKTLNGASVITDTAVTIPTVSRMCVGSNQLLNSFFYGYIKELRYYPARISNTEMSRITT